MISDLLWGDPTRHQEMQGLHPNRTRGCSIYFGVMAILVRAWLHDGACSGTCPAVAWQRPHCNI
jgi:hypothetical protein